MGSGLSISIGVGGTLLVVSFIGMCVERCVAIRRHRAAQQRGAAVPPAGTYPTASAATLAAGSPFGSPWGSSGYQPGVGMQGAYVSSGGTEMGYPPGGGGMQMQWGYPQGPYPQGVYPQGPYTQGMVGMQMPGAYPQGAGGMQVTAAPSSPGGMQVTAAPSSPGGTQLSGVDQSAAGPQSQTPNKQ